MVKEIVKGIHSESLNESIQSHLPIHSGMNEVELRLRKAWMYVYVSLYCELIFV